MAINTRSDKSILGISPPRISFSHDPKNTVPRERDKCALDSTSDESEFVFCITNAQKLSSADELFSNGKILPTQINRALSIPSYVPPKNEQQQQQQQQHKKMLKEFLSEPDDDDDTEVVQEAEKRLSSNSLNLFWRSSSVNCDGATRGKSMFRSSKLHFLSRSYSTGSAPTTTTTTTTTTTITKHTIIPPAHRLQKQSSASSFFSLSSSSSSSSSAYYFYDSCQKPSLKKNFSGNGVRITPILNLPHHKVTKSIFGFGSLFCNGKIKRKKKMKK